MERPRGARQGVAGEERQIAVGQGVDGRGTTRQEWNGQAGSGETRRGPVRQASSRPQLGSKTESQLLEAIMSAALTYTNEHETRKAVVERELGRMLKKEGTITPQGVVDSARDPKSPLHAEFIWDDAKAAQRQRLARAYELIRLTKYIYAVKDESQKPAKTIQVHVRKFVPEKSGTRRFEDRRTVLSAKQQRASFVQQKRGELAGWAASVPDVKEFDEIRGQIERWLTAN